MKIYAISGLGADERVFQYLTLNDEIMPLAWIETQKRESIENYAKRLIETYQLTTEEDFGILGVSFGGLVAVEMSKILNPKYTILISSVDIANNLPLIYRLVGKSKVHLLIPKFLLIPPTWLAAYLFGTKKKALITDILKDTSKTFAKWAIGAMLEWKNQTKIKNLIKISGDKDKLLPPKGKNINIIKNGGHFMIVDKADEISELIKGKIKNLNTNPDYTNIV